MVRPPNIYVIASSAILVLIGGFFTLKSQTVSRSLIRDRVDESRVVTLRGNTRPEVALSSDLGPVADDLPVDHMMMQLKRSPQQEQAVDQYIANLHDPKSPSFHKWLTAAEFGARFGLEASDIDTITEWLKSYGFTVHSVYPNGTVIDFSGNAGQVQRAFHTSIHNLEVNGQQHIANVSDPEIPEALAPAIAGIVSIHDFRPARMSRLTPRGTVAGGNRSESRGTGAQYTYTYSGQIYEALVPSDLATIYDFNPLFAKGITGAGQTVVVLEDTNLYRTSDWTTFRSSLGLSQYTAGTLTTVHPAPASGSGNCASPGVNSDDIEATLDAEWASAAAPSAAIEVASCANTGVTSGLYIAGQNLVNSATPPAVVSVSYGECEAENGASSNAAQYALYQQAVAEGVSIFVSAGDENAASCDQGQTSATHGIGVSAFASTPYNVAVGGTDFGDVVNGTAGQYWNLSTNSATYGSALSYIPEIPWNDSCAGSLFANYMGYATTYGAGGYCNSAGAKTGGYLVVAGGSGGPSNCATGASATFGVADGTCQGYPKPSWQAGLNGIPNDGVRDIPDVSMFASDGAEWGHYAVICFTDTTNGGEPCRGAPSSWAGVGGTSLSAPLMAGVQALINQNSRGAQGNPNSVYYSMAAKTPTAFHSITTGDIDVNCGGPESCYGFIGNIDYGRGGRIFGTTSGGVLSLSTTSFSPAYQAGGGWNFATGIGSVDVYNLVTNWGAK